MALEEIHSYKLFFSVGKDRSLIILELSC